MGAVNARYANMMGQMAQMEKQKNDMARVNQLRSLIASGVDITTPEGFNQVASLDPQAAAALRKSAEETAAANRKREDDLVVKHRNEGVAVSSMGQFEGWLNGLEADDPKSAAQFRQFMGPTFDQAKMDRIISTADQYINKNIPTARTDVQLDEQGNPGVVYSGGYDPARIIRPKTFGYDNAPAPAAAAPQGQAAPIAPEEAERFIASFPAAAQPAIRERVMRGDLGNIPMGNPAPSAGGRGGMGGPYEAIDQMPVRASSTQDGTVSNLGPQGLVETTPFRAKNPMQAPAPGTNIQTIPRITSENAAEERGKQGVRVVTDPLIKGREERVVRLEKLRGDLPKAHAQTSTLVNSLTDRINAIDEFLRNPYRNTIVGSIEGRIPKMFQNERRADAQAQWDFITNNSVLDKLIQDRQSTETGASPQGVVSDRDLGVAASAANRLTQTGSEKAQEDEMKRLRSVLYRTRESALRGYTNSYREVLNEDKRFNIAPPSVSPAYTGPLNAKRTKSGAIVENW
jgi:hypothetical protein